MEVQEQALFQSVLDLEGEPVRALDNQSFLWKLNTDHPLFKNP
jgi:hypothetical protein